MRTSLLIVLFGLFATVQAAGQTLFDVARGNANAPESFAAYEGRLYFSFVTEEYGRELWHYDPDTGRAELAMDHCPGPCSGLAVQLRPTVFDGKLFFGGYNNEHPAFGIWYYDASSRAAERVGDLPAVIVAPPLASEHGLFFPTHHPDSQDRIWRYEPGSGLTIAASGGADDRALFVSETAVYDDRLFVGGGALHYLDTEDGTLHVQDEGTARLPHVFENVLYFWRPRDAGGWTLWTYDAATDATRALAPLPPGTELSSSPFVGGYDGLQYFEASDAEHGTELWAFEPDTETFELTQDLCPGKCDSSIATVVEHAGRAYLRASSEKYSAVWWTLDGEEWVQVSSDPLPPVPAGGQAVLGDRLYFGARDVEQGSELWYVDEAGDLQRAADLSDDAAGPFGVFNWLGYREGALFVLTNDGIHRRMLWQLRDGESPTRATSDVPLSELTVGWTTDAAFHGDALYLSATDHDRGYELWALEAAGGEFHLAADLCEGACSASPRDFVEHGGRLFFTAYTADHGREVWSYRAATGRAERITMHDGNDWPESLTPAGSALYFSVRNEIWRYDLASGRTERVVRLEDVTFDMAPASLTVHDGAVYFFAADDRERSHALWSARLDAQPGSSPKRLKGDVVSGSIADVLTIYDGRVYFLVWGDTADEVFHRGTQLWHYDPATDRARPVEGAPLNPRYAAVFDGRLFFTAADEAGDRRLWYYDSGSDAVHRADMDVELRRAGGFAGLFSTGSRLYFQADDGVHGLEVWYVTPYDLRKSGPLPRRPALSVYPNPARGRTVVSYALNERAPVVLEVHDALGRRVAVLADEVREEGMHEATFDAGGLANGLYLVRLRSGETMQTRKLILMR